ADHRAVQAGQAGGPVRAATAGAGADDQPGRRLAGPPAGAAGGDRGDRGRAPVHDPARDPQARVAYRDLGGARAVPDPDVHPGRGDEPHPGQVMIGLPRPAGRCAVVGVVNVTPDSFSDGGRYLDLDAALAHARQMRAEGADLIDVGGESTRPGADRVPAAEEIRRVLPAIRALAAEGVPVSVDTTRAAVAAAAVEAGAAVVNDGSGGLGRPGGGRAGGRAAA